MVPDGPDWYFVSPSGVPMAGWNGGPDGNVLYRAASYNMWFNFFPSVGAVSGTNNTSYYNGNKFIGRSSDTSSTVAIVSDSLGISTTAASISVQEALDWVFTKDDWNISKSSTDGGSYLFPNHDWNIGGINVLFGDYHVEKRTWQQVKARARIVAGPVVMQYW